MPMQPRWHLPQLPPPPQTVNLNNPGSQGPARRLNPKVLADLRDGLVASDYRRTGKSITLLTYIAVNWPLPLLGKGPNKPEYSPIILTERQMHGDILKHWWQASFAEHGRPRFMSLGQRPEGLMGVVFTDEILLHRQGSSDRARWAEALATGGSYLKFGGGVRSYGSD